MTSFTIGIRPVVRAAIVACALLLAWGERAIARAVLSAAGGGQVRALIIGIDEYDSLPSLKGAVSDARDFERTLTNLGVADLTILLERKATRDAIMTAMVHMAQRVRIGDLVIVTFAGHGQQEPENAPCTEPDCMDEVFVLAAFQSSGKFSSERIFDKEFNKWLRELEAKQADVIFVADACFGGGLVRSIDPRTEAFSYRSGGRVQVINDALPKLDLAAGTTTTETNFERVTFMSAADESTKAPEIAIPGISGLRGALSYAVARAFEGLAQRDRDGQVSRRKLFEYSRQVVHQYSEGRQNLYTEPTRSDTLLDMPIFRVQGDDVAAKPTVERAPIRIRVANVSGDPLSGLRPLRIPFQIAKAGERADLVWDLKVRQVVSGNGDIVARGVSPQHIPPIVDRTAAVRLIAQLAELSPQTIKLLPSNDHHRAGERVQFQAQDVKDKHLILFNIAYDGTVQFLFPNINERSQVALTSFEERLRVQEPFGVDHVVAIASDSRLFDIEGAIRVLHNRRAAGDLLDILEPLRVRGPSVRIGTAGLFTVP